MTSGRSLYLSEYSETHKPQLCSTAVMRGDKGPGVFDGRYPRYLELEGASVQSSYLSTNADDRGTVIHPRSLSDVEQSKNWGVSCPHFLKTQTLCLVQQGQRKAITFWVERKLSDTSLPSSSHQPANERGSQLLPSHTTTKWALEETYPSSLLETAASSVWARTMSGSTRQLSI